MISRDNTSSDIAVGRDGVTMGWNILASLAVMALGMYVYMVLAPIKTNISTIASTVEKISVKQETLQSSVLDLADDVDERIDECEKSEALINGRLGHIERNINNGLTHRP